MIRKRRESTILKVCQVDFLAKMWYNKRLGHFLLLIREGHMKKVFVIGDSISLYYDKFLKGLLKGKAIYARKGDKDDIKIVAQDSNRANRWRQQFSSRVYGTIKK